MRAFGGRSQLLMTYLIDSGNPTLDDIKRAEAMLDSRARTSE